MALLATSLAALMLLQEGAADLPMPAEAEQPAAPCSGEEFAAFDFWVGEWTVAPNGTEAPIAYSRIERVAGGCAIRETWMPFRGGDGVSLTTLDPRTSTWHQLWIGSNPQRITFEGGPAGDAMVLSGYWGTDDDDAPQLVRMTYAPREDGTVRQHGEMSTDHGASWSDSFDLIYSPREE
ncbi:hypothetical protein [Aurantiacibacter sp. MUD61]|uniref:hypothetical protein n=1 Tax=Aurantiacibacter sp. MUD61 TaxID=3009083 RepID=UPI0022EFFF88|nr:hypothetical protein [Aurantiacibacter sp. MUD61]